MTSKLSLYWWLAIKGLAALCGALYGRRHLRGKPSVLFDVGARGGAQRKWRLATRLGVLKPVLFELDPVETARLRAGDRNLTVVEKALGEVRGRATLTVYHRLGLSSLREINQTIKKQYDYVDKNDGVDVFREVRRVEVELYPLAELIDAGEVPPPHFLKIDVQGFELEVLKGLGHHIDHVIGIELEAQFEEMYKGQPLFQEIYDWLRGHGFGMVAVRPNGLMDYNVYEVNGFFARDTRRLDDEGRHRREMWCRINQIAPAALLAIRGY